MQIKVRQNIRAALPSSNHEQISNQHVPTTTPPILRSNHKPVHFSVTFQSVPIRNIWLCHRTLDAM